MADTWTDARTDTGQRWAKKGGKTEKTDKNMSELVSIKTKLDNDDQNTGHLIQ